MHSEQRVLDHVLGLGDAAEHPVGDRERHRPQLGKQLLAIGHDAANPSRQLGCAGFQDSSRFALAFDAPRISVIILTPVLPTASRPTRRGTRIGFLPPSMSARAGSHSLTGAGSSSTTLYAPRLPCSIAATVASAASATWMKDHTPAPLPTTGNLRLRISSNCNASVAIGVSGP